LSKKFKEEMEYFRNAVRSHWRKNDEGTAIKNIDSVRKDTDMNLDYMMSVTPQPTIEPSIEPTGIPTYNPTYSCARDSKITYAFVCSNGVETTESVDCSKVSFSYLSSKRI